jgi:translocation protein SEC62
MDGGMTKVADLMLANENVRTNESTSRAKRVKYFKGSRMLKALVLEPKLPEVKTDKDALRCATALLHSGRYFFRAKKNEDKDDRRNKLLPLSGASAGGRFEPKDYYVWIHEGSKRTANMYTTLLVVCFLAMCMFPIWPSWAKVGLWYVSVTLLLFMLGFTLIRLVLFMAGWIFGYEFWILPNVFDEELPFWDSFKPGYSFEPSGEGQALSRAAVLALFLAFGYWVFTQPTDFDKYIHVQRSFIDDLYSGALLSDKSQEEIDKMDQPAHPTVEELMREEAEDAETIVNPNANVDPNRRGSDLEGEALDAYLESMMETHEDAEDDEDGSRGDGAEMEIDDGADDF